MKTVAFLSIFLVSFGTHAQQVRNDVVIAEIMADPAPAVGGLPETEFIELRNFSLQAVNLNGWKVGKTSGLASINSNFILQPDSMVILCNTGNVAVLSRFGPALGVSNFPTLDNDGDLVFLQS
ncbi:MAG TPA: lamin tail domain-containing protein, partial [Chitinophagaceae bacterium]|nr:lamin tail domain-containing protein [Chitinophagaceae bacterium]